MRRSKAAQAAAAAALIGAVALGCGSEQKEPAGAAPAAPQAPAPAAPAPVPAPPAPAKAAPAPAPDDAAAATREAGQIFSLRCSTCHGPEGRGDGPGSVALDPKPRNYHDAAWQASVTDEYLAKIIVVGGPAVGRSPLMPPNPDLAAKPDVVAALVAHIRSLAKP